MKALALALAVAACSGQRAVPASDEAAPRARRVHAPPSLDPSVRGATYLGEVAARLAPGWSQFLDDCRMRLPEAHALNRMALSTTVDLAIEKTGGVSGLDIAPSGSADFDRAVRDAIVDVAPLPAPPIELVSDDDRVHLRWLFARDDRQAGPATATIVMVELPLGTVVERLVANHELARAAKRIAAAPSDPDLQPAVTRLMIGVLRESLGSADAAVRRAAVDAIGRGRVAELAPDIRALLPETSDMDMRLVAIQTAGALGDDAAAKTLAAELASDLVDHPRLAIAETRALVQLGHAADATAAIEAALPKPIALEALAVAPIPSLQPKLAGWLAHGDARTRAGVCAALAGGDADWTSIATGLRDHDASVRAACSDAAAAHRGHVPADVGKRLHELASDRDTTARAHAIAAIVAIDPDHAPRAAEDKAAGVRIAYATALGAAIADDAMAVADAAGNTASDGSTRGGDRSVRRRTDADSRAAADADLRTLADDNDADVRAAAYVALVRRAGDDALAADLAAGAARDKAPQVRIAAMPKLVDENALARLAGDDDPMVATAATVRLAHVRGRAAISRPLLDRVAVTSSGSAERVRVALAWLLAP